MGLLDSLLQETEVKKMNLVASLSLVLLSFAVIPSKSQLRPYSIANDIRVNTLLSSQDRLAGVRRLAPSTELVREEPAGSGRVVVLGRARQDPDQGAQSRQGAEEFGEWATPGRGDADVREEEIVGRHRTRIGSRRVSPSRRFKPSRPLQNSNPVHLRRQAGVGQVGGQEVQENWSSSQGEAALEEERWGLQEQAEENWLAPQQSVWPQQQEEERRFYNELKWKQGGEEEGEQQKRLNFQPLTQRLGGQRNPRSSFF